MISRWPFYASVAVLLCACIGCILAGYIEWGQQEVMVSANPPEAPEQARFAVELYAIGALNLVACVAFLLRRSGWAWWLVLGVQVIVFLLAVVEGALTDIGWYYFGCIPLFTLFLLFAIRWAQARSKPTPAVVGAG